MKAWLLSLACPILMAACSKRDIATSSPPLAAPDASSSFADDSVPVTNEHGVSLRLPADFKVLVDAGGGVESFQVPTGGFVKLSSSAACGTALRAFCRRMDGRVKGDECIEREGSPRKMRMRVLDGVTHWISVEGDVPPYVLGSWAPPTESVKAYGYFCQPMGVDPHAGEQE